jgi:LuxR family maltose regulon positive regulatory protein
MNDAVAYARKALKYLPAREEGWRSVSLSTLGIHFFESGQLREARATLKDAQTMMLKMNNPGFARAFEGMSGVLLMEMGKISLGLEIYKKLLVEAKSVQDLDDIAHAQIGIAYALQVRNELTDLKERLGEAMAIAEDMRNQDMLVFSMVALARLEATRGEYAVARQRLTIMLTQLKPETPHLYLRHQRMILYEQALIALQQGDYQTTQHWWQERQGNRNEFPTLLLEREKLLHARLLLAQGQRVEAVQVLEELLRKAQQNDHPLLSWEIQAALILAYQAQGAHEQALMLLQDLLEKTRSEAPLRIFLDQGPGMELFLAQQASIARTRDAHLQRIQQAFQQESGHTQLALPVPIQHERLSSQELKVLRLLASGRSNPEIADELVVSVNTVRTQVKSIYRKLEVNNRVAASEAARQQGLI